MGREEEEEEVFRANINMLFQGANRQTDKSRTNKQLSVSLKTKEEAAKKAIQIHMLELCERECQTGSTNKQHFFPDDSTRRKLRSYYTVHAPGTWKGLSQIIILLINCLSVS